MKSLLKVLLALSLLVGGVAFAQEDEDPVKAAKEHYKLGLDAYKAGKYDVAIKELKKAYSLKKIPALLINLAATYRKSNDTEAAVHFYKKFLEEAPDGAPQRADVEKALAEIQQEEKAKTAKTEVAKEERKPPEEERPAPAAASKSEFTHNVVDAAPPDQPLDVRVSMPVMKGVKVFVLYRGSGESEFKSVLMKRRGAEKVGRIPASVLSGKSIQYYIEAKDPKGKVVASSGSVTNPNVVLVDADAPPQIVFAANEEREEPQPVAAQEADEQPRPSKKQAERAKQLDEEAAPLTEDDDERRAEAEKANRARTPGKLGPITQGGIALAVIGAASIVVAVVGAVQSNRFAQAVENDSKEMNPPYRFNDPNLPEGQQNDAYLESQGKLWHNLGIGLAAGGAVLAAGGITMALVDTFYLRRPHKKMRKRIQVEDEVSRSIQLSPQLGPGYAGAGGSFRF